MEGEEVLLYACFQDKCRRQAQGSRLQGLGTHPRRLCEGAFTSRIMRDRPHITPWSSRQHPVNAGNECIAALQMSSDPLL